jgi:hypothetical protein
VRFATLTLRWPVAHRAIAVTYEKALHFVFDPGSDAWFPMTQCATGSVQAGYVHFGSTPWLSSVAALEDMTLAFCSKRAPVGALERTFLQATPPGRWPPLCGRTARATAGDKGLREQRSVRRPLRGWPATTARERMHSQRALTFDMRGTQRRYRS